jgi:two-component system NarL family sensor kinase
VGSSSSANAPEEGSRAELEARIRDQEAEIRRLRQERSELVGQLLHAEEETRRQVAQGLHDDALQSLLAAHQELIEAAPGRVGVTRAHDVVSVAIDRVREAVIALHPVTREQGGLEAALGAIASQAERRGGFSCSVELDAEAIGIHDELVLSIARELLTNAVKHSRAEHVSVTLSPVEGRQSGIVLEVADDGRGVGELSPEEAVRQGHLGLASIAQRVEAVGGTFALESPPAKGTTARAWLPPP